MERRLQFRTSHVADMADIEETTLRGYLNRENIFLDGIAERQGTKDFRFSLEDVLRVAIISRLLARGMTSAKEASGFVEKILGSILSPKEVVDALKKDDFSVLPRPYYPEREQQMIHLLMNTEFCAWFDKKAEKWRFTLEAKHGEGASDFLIVGEHPDYFLVGADTYIGIHLGAVVVTILKRLHEIEKKESL